MKKILLTLILICMITAAYASNMTIEADKQSFSGNQDKALFEGNVKVTLDDVVVTSPRATADVNPKTKKLTMATFLDKAYVHQIKNNKKNEVKANIIKVSLLNKVITAEGSTQTVVMENKTASPTVIINADVQEYDTMAKVMRAKGSVTIDYKDIKSFSNEGTAYMEKDGNVKEIQLNGNAQIKQKNSTITAVKFTYNAKSEIATASGTVYSDIVNDDGSRMQVWAGLQQYEKKSNILMASNNVRVIYKDYNAQGPKATVFPDEKNKLNKIVFTGRSKITQEGRTIEADKIILTLNPKDFYAEGNVKTSIPNVKSLDEN